MDWPLQKMFTKYYKVAWPVKSCSEFRTPNALSEKKKTHPWTCIVYRTLIISLRKISHSIIQKCYHPWQFNLVLTLLSSLLPSLLRYPVSDPSKPHLLWRLKHFLYIRVPLLTRGTNPLEEIKMSLFQRPQKHSQLKHLLKLRVQPPQAQKNRIPLKKLRFNSLSFHNSVFMYVYVCLCACIIVLFWWVLEFVENWGGGEASGDAKAGVEVHMDGEEHWSSSWSGDTRAWHNSPESLLLLAEEGCMGGAQDHSRK